MFVIIIYPTAVVWIMSLVHNNAIVNDIYVPIKDCLYTLCACCDAVLLYITYKSTTCIIIHIKIFSEHIMTMRHAARKQPISRQGYMWPVSDRH